MPPKGRLNDAEMAELTEWVRTGAVWPESRTTSATGSPASRTTKGPAAFWAFQAPRDPAPPEVQAVDWPCSPLDRFILAALERKGLAPASPADKRTLIRRATFDLTGLPPTPEEVDVVPRRRLVRRPSQRVVDRLLASPRYGERWGRHWLDLARYADSNGMDENVAYANAFRYRDYVIHAFNADKPYDQFVKEQIAGDLLARTGDDRLNHERLTATGFLVIGPKMLAEDDPVKMEMDIIDEQVDTVGRVFMGLTIGCARCHDHKFDPIPTADYYALAGIFKSTRSMQNHKVVAMWNERPLGTEAQRAAFEVHEREVNRRTAEIKARVDEAKAALTRNGRALSENPEADFPPETVDELRRLRKDLAEFEKKAPPLRKVMSVEEQAITNLRVHIRGNHLTLGEEVPRRFPRILAGADQTPIDASRSGRLELASWLAQPDHPLTARVMVNRIWLWHFGDGLVRSPDNFGRLGDRPVHPELLDWLAHRFVESGWSIKAMHRLIMLSSTYQMSTRYDSQAALVDPENRLHWRMSRRRLEAEAIRDAILAVSGELDRDDGRHAAGREEPRLRLLDRQGRRRRLQHQSPLGLPARDPQRSLRCLPGVRLRRPERLQRPAGPDDRRTAGAFHDERPAGSDGARRRWPAGCSNGPVSTMRAASGTPTWPRTGDPRSRRRSPAPWNHSAGSVPSSKPKGSCREIVASGHGRDSVRRSSRRVSSFISTERNGSVRGRGGEASL